MDYWPVPPAEYRLVKLSNGTHSLRCLAYTETMHPGLGPIAEAEALYVHQLKLDERLPDHAGEFVVWDVGLGAAANAVAFLRASRAVPGETTLVSFDQTKEMLRFALEHREPLGYFNGYEEPLQTLLERQQLQWQDGARQVGWRLHLSDFPELLAGPEAARLPKPHAILYDAFSPVKNPEMWMLPLFTNLFRLLDPARPCLLATYSRSQMVRVTLLLAGFFVGRGRATGEKEETTVAANDLSLIELPLDRAWLERLRQSGGAEPLTPGHYRQAPLSPESLEKLLAHPQFRG